MRRLLAATPVVRDREQGWVSSLIAGLESTKDRDLLVAGVWTSAVAWGLEALMYYLVGEAFGLDQPFPVYLLVAAAANVIVTAPSTSGGVGPFEWAAKEVLLLFLVGAEAEAVAIAYAASLHGLVLVPMALLGLFLLWLYQVPIRRQAGEQGTAAPESDPAAEAPLR